MEPKRYGSREEAMAAWKRWPKYYEAKVKNGWDRGRISGYTNMEKLWENLTGKQIMNNEKIKELIAKWIPWMMSDLFPKYSTVWE